jgi:hypothetical protein
MELNDRNALFGLIKLTLSAYNLKIDKPKEAIVISKQEYYKLVKEKVNEQ